MTSVLIRVWPHEDRDTQGERHVRTEAEVEVVRLEYPRLRGTAWIPKIAHPSPDARFQKPLSLSHVRGSTAQPTPGFLLLAFRALRVNCCSNFRRFKLLSLWQPWQSDTPMRQSLPKSQHAELRKDKRAQRGIRTQRDSAPGPRSLSAQYPLPVSRMFIVTCSPSLGGGGPRLG